MEPSTFAWNRCHMGVATGGQILGPGWRSWNRTKAVQPQGYCGWRILIGPKKTVKLGRVQFFGAAIPQMILSPKQLLYGSIVFWRCIKTIEAVDVFQRTSEIKAMAKKWFHFETCWDGTMLKKGAPSLFISFSCDFNFRAHEIFQNAQRSFNAMRSWDLIKRSSEGSTCRAPVLLRGPGHRNKKMKQSAAATWTHWNQWINEWSYCGAIMRPRT